MQQYPKKFIIKYLLNNLPNQIQNQNDAEKYYALFGGNMQNIINFKQSDSKLDGFVFLFSFFKI